MHKTWVQSLGQEDCLEKEMATHSSTLAWKIPWMKEPGGLQSTGSQKSDTTEPLHLLLERKAITDLDSILKSRDITLLTKVRIVKAMVFPVGTDGCESWTIKKAEH